VCALLPFALATAQVQSVNASEPSVSGEWTLRGSDKIFLISSQAETMAPMTFRVGTVDQLQTVQAGGGKGWGAGTGWSGYYADVFADFAPLSWLQVGLTMNYGTIGDPATINLPAPTAYVKAQFLRQASAGVNMAAAVNVKKIGFSRPASTNPNDGEIEAQLLLDKRIGQLTFAANGVFGKSFSAPDSDAEFKLSAGYFLLHNLLVGLDCITRYDTSFDGGPKDGTRYVEFTGGAVVTWKVGSFALSALGGVAAPMHTPVGYVGLGPTAMIQIAYSP
jgi:hypothetical protein